MKIHDHFLIVHNSSNPLLTRHGGWVTAESGTNTQFQSVPAEAGHSGILRIKTSNSPGSFGRLFMAPSGWHLATQTQPNSIYYDDHSIMEWEARVTDLSSMAFTLSIADSIYLNRAVAFKYDHSVSNNLVCFTSGVAGPESTLLPIPDALFHTYRAEMSLTSVKFYIDGTQVAEHMDTSKLPIGSSVSPYAAIFARVGAYKHIDIDRFDLE